MEWLEFLPFNIAANITPLPPPAQYYSRSNRAEAACARPGPAVTAPVLLLPRGLIAEVGAEVKPAEEHALDVDGTDFRSGDKQRSEDESYQPSAKAASKM